MERLIKFGIFVLLIVCVLPVFAQQVQVLNPLRFLALGDSYTIGQSVSAAESWPVQLTERLKSLGVETAKLEIIAQTGWRTDDLLDAIASEKPDSNYNMVSLLVGVNNQYQGVDIDRYPGEFRQLLEKAIEFCGGRKEGVFVLSIPDYGYTPFGAYARESISAEIDEYNSINLQISSQMNVKYFNITPISQEAISKPEYLAFDQLHPSGEMYAAWIDLMFDSSGFNIVSTDVAHLIEADNVVVFPNPAANQINFILSNNANEITVYNSLGNIVYNTEIKSLKSFCIDISCWKSGIYFYRIKNAKQKFLHGKVVVK